MPPIKIGIIGCGHWGPNHLRVFSQISESRPVAIADADARRLGVVQAMFPSLQGYTDYRKLLENKDIDAVVIATPTATHFTIVCDALNAGKHVLCEKPLCTCSKQGEELTVLAEEKGLVLMVGHVFLFNSGILKIKELVMTGEVGEIRSLSAVRTNLGPIRSDVNAAWDLASHDIAIFNWILGAVPTEVQAMGAAFLQRGVEDVVNISLRYPCDVLASIQCSWLDPKKVRQITLVGSKKMITWNDLALSNPVAIYEKGVQKNIEINDYGEFLKLSMVDGDVHLPKVKATEPLKTQNETFVYAIRKGEKTYSDGKNATNVVAILEKIQKQLNNEK